MTFQTDLRGADTLWVADLGRQPYLSVWKLQKALAEARRKDGIPDVLLLTEHDPVFTLGRRGERKNLRVPETFLEERKIPHLVTDRGGDVTYHGPGQLVGYPVLRMPGGGRRVQHYVKILEEAMIRTLGRFGVPAGRNPGHPGVWAGGAKIGFVGLAVQGEVCFHGFALNLDLDLTPFSWIHPCGLKETRVTSLKELVMAPPASGDVRATITEALCLLMGYEARFVSPAALLP
jgi:lipoyl(octanoyl) transferase